MNTVVQMGMGEILYFLIGIGWVLYSWNKKKKEREAQHTHQDDYEPTEENEVKSEASSVLEEIMAMHAGGSESAIENIFEKPKEKPIKEKPSTNVPYFKNPEPVPAPPKGIDTVDSDYFEKIKMGEQVKRSTKKKERKKPILTEPQEAPDFDLREAVINSEILNRKY